MRARVEKCRWLASMINDPEGKRMLLQIAEDGEADIAKLQAEEAQAAAAIHTELPPQT
jgi:hypothetical protein